MPVKCIPRLTALWVSLLLAVLLGACTQGPDADRLADLVRSRLDAALGPGALAVTELRRLGSGPLTADAEGHPRRIVYYSAVLTFGRDLDFSAWDSLNVAALATLLGITEKGARGLHHGGNHQGDTILVQGGLSFRAEGDGWAPVEAVFPAVGTPSAGYSPGTSAQSQRVIERIGKLFERQTADPSRQRQIITEELDNAYSAITLRLDRLDRALILAGGPADGEYLVVARLLAQTLVSGGLAADAVETAGSMENLALLRSGRADIALVQGNVADEAQLGTGPFDKAGPYYDLRALASLFPEPVHVIVAKGAPIHDLKDLAGRRVEIGLPDSGSRANSILLLEAAGVGLKELAAIHEEGLDRGLKRLSDGELDAVIATISAPARRIQEAAASGGIRLLPLPQGLRDTLAVQVPGLVPAELRTATYPGQREAVATIATTALLVAPSGLPATDVERTLAALFDQIDFVAAGAAAGSLIRRQSANLGLTIPLHPAAVAFLGLGGETTPKAPPAGPQ
jgi:TRAP transporter TAXI family solute receptor